MTETSYFWDDTLIGDATIARYDSLEFLQRFRQLIIGTGGFIVPNYANNLQVVATSPASAGVTLQSGAAVIRNRFYDNDSDLSLTIAANASGNPRIDSIILTSDVAAQTVRASILQGTPAASPSQPALTQTTGIYQIRVANIWVANGFATITDNEIYSTIEYLPTVEELGNKKDVQNLIKNSEYLAWGSDAVPVQNNLPTFWYPQNLAVTPTKTTRPSEQRYGFAQSYNNTSGAAITLYTSAVVESNTDYTIKGLIRCTTGLVNMSIIARAVDANGNGSTISTLRTYTVYPTGDGWLSVKFTFNSGAGANLEGVVIQFDTVGGPTGEQFEIGQIIMVKGFYVGPYRHFNEDLYFFREALDTFSASPAWVSWEARVVAAGSFGVARSFVNFANTIVPGITAVRINFQLTAAAGGTTVELTTQDGNNSVGTPIRTIVLAGGASAEVNEWFPYNHIGLSAAQGTFFRVSNTGANNVTVTARVIGVK